MTTANGIFHKDRVVQSQSNPLLMMSLMGGRSGGGFGSGLMKIMNNPFLLCKETETVVRIPCRRNPKICDFISIKEYRVPNLMSCSPMGFKVGDKRRREISKNVRSAVVRTPLTFPNLDYVWS
ncbi:hypothetical protein KUTeg_000909 [Tegillarca granosa]|uniref:Uncharacterized protein n=1 Tax=Tegillarca granosa TaxID=220873 RepID=A0ABQ9G0R0_TEGGR|nr:hypothetical protein KUTeg_001066 [Tegillarca granosa]KAJ8321538.1 hypothetical protein KUTeg_000909 [Tegillarca granosa]